MTNACFCDICIYRSLQSLRLLLTPRFTESIGGSEESQHQLGERHEPHPDPARAHPRLRQRRLQRGGCQRRVHQRRTMPWHLRVLRPHLRRARGAEVRLLWLRRRFRRQRRLVLCSRGRRARA